MSGSRGVVYLTAALPACGVASSCNWNGGICTWTRRRPFVNVRASISKNHKQAMLPLHSDLVKALGRMQKRRRRQWILCSMAGYRA